MHINTYILIVAILSFYCKNIYNNKLIGSICVQVAISNLDLDLLLCSFALLSFFKLLPLILSQLLLILSQTPSLLAHWGQSNPISNQVSRYPLLDRLNLFGGQK